MAKRYVSTEARRRQLKYGTQGMATVATPPATGSATTASSSSAASQQTSDGRNFGYVTRDLRGILMIGGTLLVFELALAYAFDHTGLGTAVYRLITI